jgi:hypothetical protein
MVDFIDEKERELFARAQLGSQTRQFLDSDLGRYLHGRAKQEIEQAQVDALEVDAVSWRWWRNRHKLLKLQMKAAVARQFLRWIIEAIQDGEIAFQELNEYRKEET